MLTWGTWCPILSWRTVPGSGAMSEPVPATGPAIGRNPDVASLTVIKGPDQGRRFEIDAPVPTLGRDTKNDVRLHDSEISRHHAELRRTEEGYVLYDLKSSNGTFLNGKKIECSLVRTGDRIRIGQSEMIFTADPPSHPPSSDLIGRINMITDGQEAESSAIISSIKHSQGSEFLRHPERAGSQWLKDALSNLAVMYETSQAVSKISDVGQLLDHIMDLVFRSIKPDRGCIVLRNAQTGKLEPTSVHFAEGIDEEGSITLSQTIMDWVLKREEGMLVLDATQDRRFASARSVVQMGILEAICVPLRGRHEMLGVLYVDKKGDRKQILKTQRPSKFTEDHLKLVIAIAHQAGLAIEDSRFYQAMVEAEKLAAIGQTIATLSHHIKNILQGIRAGSYVIEMGFKDEDLQMLQKGWTVVEKNQSKIYNLVMDMLSYSKDREPVLEATDVNQLVGDVVELMQPRAKDVGVVLTTKLGEGLADIALDTEGIHRALLNIVTNAIDAVEHAESGQVQLATSTAEQGRYLHISVSDNGVGIAEDQLQGIFRIFNSTKGSRGSGLGLAVSQKIAREHGGKITVTSNVGTGSRFTIELPIRRLPASPSDQAASPLIFETNVDFHTQMDDE